jgi:enterochelin esterase-like enzyme
MRLVLLLLLCCIPSFTGEKLTAVELLQMSARNSPEFADALTNTLGAEPLTKGAAFIGEGPNFLFATQAASAPTLYVDDQASGQMVQVEGHPQLWFKSAQLTPGTSHYFHYIVNGAKFGGRNDVPAYTSDSYAQPGVPQGKITGKLSFASKIYDGMQSDYWIYVPAQYNANTPAALMVWQDGHNFAVRDGGSRIQNVIDNLTAQKKIPVMISVFVDPGKVGAKAMRSIEYDTMSDAYARFLRDEILPEVAKSYNIRKDSYSRAIGGESSGGICSFTVAWHQPDQFSRVLSRIGSFTSIQWHPGELDGGNVYPFAIRKQPKRNIRVWLQDGSEDLENQFGSWPLQNIQMANSLKRQDYDFHLSFGTGTHSTSQGNAELPASMAWLWRDYDSAKTEQVYAMEAGEKDKPMFRVHVYNR